MHVEVRHQGPWRHVETQGGLRRLFPHESSHESTN